MIIYDCYNRPYIDPLRKTIIENWDLNNKEDKTMIKANELRIGNYILFKEYGKGKGKIGQIKPGDFSRVAGDDPEESEYHPIPLTPEWLERCGFKPSSLNDTPGMASNNYQLGSICVKIKNDISVWDYDGPNISVKYHKNIKHIHSVHQLQNLYFALTGEELFP